MEEVPSYVLDSIKKNGVCLKGTLYTPLSKWNTSNQSLNVQLRKQLDLHVNLVHGFSLPGIKTRHEGIDIVVIVRCCSCVHTMSHFNTAPCATKYLYHVWKHCSAYPLSKNDLLSLAHGA